MRQFLTSYIFLLVTFCQGAVGQVKKTMHFSSRNEMFCSQTIILDSTGLFFSESGCEARSNVSFGKYKLGKDNKISFQYLPFDSIKPIAKIIQEESIKENDSLITITFLDRYNHPLSVNFGIRLQDTTNKVHEFWTDEKGQVKANPFLFKYVFLIQFLTLYPEMGPIEIGQKSLKVYLNLPEIFLAYPEMKLDLPSKLRLQLKQNGLYDLQTKAIAYKLD